jgi:hypothetical protein
VRKAIYTVSHLWYYWIWQGKNSPRNRKKEKKERAATWIVAVSGLIAAFAALISAIATLIVAMK